MGRHFIELTPFLSRKFPVTRASILFKSKKCLVEIVGLMTRVHELVLINYQYIQFPKPIDTIKIY
jgi:hypothetical protein